MKVLKAKRLLLQAFRSKIKKMGKVKFELIKVRQWIFLEAAGVLPNTGNYFLRRDAIIV